jgi:phosphate uptake regulator
MKRKIIKQGHNTLTVTLPSKWAQELNLKAGTEVDIVENGRSIVITGDQKPQFKSTTIDIENLSVPMLWRFFQAAYREGYDEIKLIYDENKKYEDAFNYYVAQFEYSKMGEKPQKKEAIDSIQGMVNRFIGVEVIDHGEGFCIVREMGDISDKEFDHSLRRIFLLIDDLFDKVLLLIKNNKTGDISICKSIHTLDLNIDRFIDYCCRINNKLIHSSPRNKQVMFTNLFMLELLGDEFKYIGTHLARSKKPVSEITPFAESIKEHFDLYQKMFFNFDKEKIVQFGKNDFKIYNDHFKWRESKNKDVVSIRRHLMQISKFIFCLAELRIEMHFSENGTATMPELKK